METLIRLKNKLLELRHGVQIPIGSAVFIDDTVRAANEFANMGLEYANQSSRAIDNSEMGRSLVPFVKGSAAAINEVDNMGLYAPLATSAIAATGDIPTAAILASDIYANSDFQVNPFTGQLMLKLPKTNELYSWRLGEKVAQNLRELNGGKISRKKVLRKRRFSRYRK